MKLQSHTLKTLPYRLVHYEGVFVFIKITLWGQQKNSKAALKRHVTYPYISFNESETVVN